jgi:Dolichyl-phosphate-mannose-protein mannosyltransferase
VPPFLVGAALRLWNLPAQVLGGDELHTVRAAVSRPLGEVLTTYRAADPSLPLAGLFRALIDCGVELSEVGLRLPGLVCGLLLLLVVPVAVGRVLGGRAAVLLAWLLALSPSLVLYSRIVRAYSPVVLLGAVAAVAFFSWWEGGRVRSALAFVAAGALAAWLHLGTAPLLGGLFVFALGDLFTRPAGERGARLRRLLLLGAGLGGACALFLVPAWASLARLVALKRHPRALSWEVVPEVLRLLAGSRSVGLGLLVWGLAVAGLVLLVRDRPRLGAFALVLIACQVVGILLLAPVGLEVPWVLARYLLPVLPAGLLGVAYLFGRPFFQVERGWVGFVPVVAAGGLIVVLALAGPLADTRFRRSSFQNQDDLAWSAVRAELPGAAVSAFYRQLAGSGERAGIVEVPWMFLWRFRAFYLYQDLHGQPVRTATFLPLIDQPGLALRNTVAARPDALCSIGGSGARGARGADSARYVVVHRDLVGEERRIAPPPGFPAPALPPTLARRLRREAGRLTRQLTREWGPPVYADADLRVWDLARSCPQAEGR